MAGKNRLKDLFHSMAGHAIEEDMVAEKVRHDLGLEEEDLHSPSPAPEEEEPDYGRIHEVKGSLLQVWQKWAGDVLSPPVLSLSRRIPKDAPRLDRKELEREVVRLTVQLEQDAKRRMREVEAVEQRNAEARRRAQEAGEDPDQIEESCLDALCRVYLSRDKMVAWVFLFPPVGEAGGLPAEAIGKALQEYGVTTGINAEGVVKIFRDKLYFELLPIAIGTPAVEGENGSVIEQFERSLPLEIKIDDMGMADYKCTNYVRQIMKDDVISVIVPPVPGQPGLRVDGTVVEPKAVKAAKVPRGANTAITEDGLQLIATMDGHLEYSNDAFTVRPVLEIQGDVDYSVGNIEFTGDVHVHGDVRENFVINATGSVMIEGLVEAATVEAGGDLVITRGVVGDHRALLRSGGSVRVKYLENCVVYAGKGVFADCAMNSQVFSDTAISVVTGRGSVIGGTMVAAQAIQAKMIGAQSGRRTELYLGVLPFVQNELINIQDDLEANRREQEELERTLAYLEREQGMKDSDPRLAKGRMRRSVLEMKAQQLRRRQEQLEPMTPDLSKCLLDCEVVYPVTSLTIQERTLTLKEVRKHCKLKFDTHTGEIVDAI